MPDDDTFREDNGAQRSPSRSDDAPSTVPRRRPPDAPPAVPGAARARTRLRRLLALRRPTRRTMAVGVVCCLGMVGLAPAGGDIARLAGSELTALRSEPGDRGRGGQPASRSVHRSPTATPPAAPATPAPTAAAPTAAAPTAAAPGPTGAQPGRTAVKPRPSSPAPKRAKAPAKRGPAHARPVAGLTVAQMRNAETIVRTGRKLGLPRRALVIAVATAWQESKLLNLASGVLPESLDLPNQGVGWDHDSVGVFQQRSSAGWGPVHRLMDPAYAAARFFEALVLVPGWQQMALTDAAQAVQGSAFPYAYAPHEPMAAEVVDAVLAVLS